MFFVSSASMVRGKVAADDDVPKAVAKTLAMLPIKRKGNDRVKITVEKKHIN